MTTWHPDTCGCVIDNYHLPNAAFQRRCARHSVHTPADVLTENQYKNNSVKPLLDKSIPFRAAFDGQSRLVLTVADKRSVAGLITDPNIIVNVDPFVTG